MNEQNGPDDETMPGKAPASTGPEDSSVSLAASGAGNGSGDWSEGPVRRLIPAGGQGEGASPGEVRLVVDVEGYEGPLDLLLSMARTQKVDLRKISVLALAEQYLAFVEEAKRLRLELAADYLVMAAWLAYLKSRLLLPPDPEEEGPSGEELAAHLAFQLERLQAMREAAARLMARDRLGRDIFPRGMPEEVAEKRNVAWQVGLMDLLAAYARIRTRDEFRPYAFDRRDVYTMEEALDHLRGVIGSAIEWLDLEAFLPEGWRTEPHRRRAALAATFAASLELAKAGKVEIAQEGTFAPLRLRRRLGGPVGEPDVGTGGSVTSLAGASNEEPDQ